MPIEPWFVVGAGGHARVVMDALLAKSDGLKSFAFVDDDPALHDRHFFEVPVLGSLSDVVKPGSYFHVALGDNHTRQAVYRRLMLVHSVPFKVAHPASCISPYATINEASFIAAGAVVAPAVSIGVGVIVNHGAVVDHDCIVRDFSHIAPCATLAGGVIVGCCVLVGAGANVLPGISIGDGAVIGAGAVVTADVPPNSILAGVPARAREKVSR